MSPGRIIPFPMIHPSELLRTTWLPGCMLGPVVYTWSFSRDPDLITTFLSWKDLCRAPEEPKGGVSTLEGSWIETQTSLC